MYDKPLIIAIMGPTATGKTALAVKFAKGQNGEVISADSMQIYRDMDIATAKPTEEEREGIPHHLIDIADPTEEFSVTRFIELAGKAAEDILSRGKLPILVGGTGLYITSFMENLQFSEEEKNPVLRAELEAFVRENGSDVLHRELQAIDPETAADLHSNNIGRVIRAVEIYRATGITMSEHRRRSRMQPSPYRFRKIGLDFKNRDDLYERINARVDRMFADGLLEEAKKVLSTAKKTAMQAIGYKELVPYFSGEITLDEAKEKIKRETRRYAKRQLTWFRRDPEINWRLL